MLKANDKKIDVNNLNLDRSYTLEEFEFINDHLKTCTLEIDGQPINLFELDKNGKLIPMPQSPYAREIVVAEIERFNFDIGGGKMIRAPDVAYTSKEIHRSLNKKQIWSFRGEPFTPVFVVEIGYISNPESKKIHVYKRGRRYINHRWKDIDGRDFLPRLTLEI
ncbi:hypothetical protein C2G38_2190893 [Gigaspora rosea]|uniref:Restriction endonuclease domain-containing protein n=1 Tax=Gigaspora rosea TaxID=44941 RepID=A0A397V265_9GLOM|nr:hypothetical protein C2G38_2190893 [Gigaspora rosea]